MQETSQNSQHEQFDEQHEQEFSFTTAPNILTMIRMFFVPVVVGCLFIKKPSWDLVAAIIFGVASITDFFDGYLARTQKSVTVYGKLMDPLADKFLVVSSLIVLQFLGRIHPIVNILLICREIAVTGLRAVASAEGVVIAASSSAKWKTATQMFAIPFLMVKQGLFGIPLYPIGQVLLYVSLAISLWSAKDYIVGFFHNLKEARRKKAQERRQLREARKAEKEAFRAARLQQHDHMPPHAQ